MSAKKFIGGAVMGAVLAAGLTVAVSRSGDAKPATTQLEQMSAAAATANHALGPRVRYLSSAWQNLLGISNRAEQLKAMGLKPNLAMLAAPATASAPVPAGHFGAVSAPPRFPTDGTGSRFSTFTTSESATAWCGGNAVIAYNDTGSLLEAFSYVGYSQSSDAGTSFTDGGAPPSFSSQPVGGLAELIGDPVAKCTSAHNFFISSLFESCTDIDPLTGLCLAGTSGVTVSPSTDGGKTFGQPLIAVSMDLTTHIVDKDWMTVDRSTGNIYVTYTDYDYSESVSGCTNIGDVFSSIDLVESTDGGNTWSSAQQVAGACDEELQGSQVVIGSGGTVYVGWETISGIGATREIDVASSTSGGPFSTPVTVSSVSCSGDCFELQGMIRTNEFPSLAINPKGTLFITWQDGDNQVPDALAPLTSGGVTGSYGFTDIKFSKSSDGGQTWLATPVRVNGNPASTLRDHFEPTVAVGGGRIAICFYDRRNDPLNFKIDRYCANSTDGGSTWTNTRITAASFYSVVNQDFLIATNYMGDYDAMAADALGRHTGFIDSYAANNPGYPRVQANQF